MKRPLSLLLAISACISFALSQEVVPTTVWDYHAKEYFAGVNVRIVTIESTSGESLRLEIPKGIVLAIYCTNELTKRTDKGQTLIDFQGMISVRTKSSSAIVQGRSMNDQMDLTPLRIDLDNAKVTLEIKQ